MKFILDNPGEDVMRKHDYLKDMAFNVRRDDKDPEMIWVLDKGYSQFYFHESEGTVIEETETTRTVKVLTSVVITETVEVTVDEDVIREFFGIKSFEDQTITLQDIENYLNECDDMHETVYRNLPKTYGSNPEIEEVFE